MYSFLAGASRDAWTTYVGAELRHVELKQPRFAKLEQQHTPLKTILLEKLDLSLRKSTNRKHLMYVLLPD